MGFWDDLGATITQKSNDISNKTKDLMEIQTLGGDIDKANKLLKQQYQALGTRMYLAKKDEVPEEFADIFGEISETHKRISEMEARKEFLKNRPTRFCTNCGTELTPDALFCTSCGKKVEDEK